jgi:pimeloyl-ACP methyl ester carboxylesterase
VLLIAAAPASARPRFWECADFKRLQCTKIRVPLDRSGTVAGTVRLRVARFPFRRGRPTLVYLAGGPGGAGVEDLVSTLQYVTLRDRFNLVAFDQRGTGRSGVLRCRALERARRLRSIKAAAACARRIGPRRAFYTTRESVEDTEAVRAAVGASKLTLFGTSYGTKLALAYARAHPDRVERLLLDSVVDPDERDPFDLDSFQTMAPTLMRLCPAGCRGVSADPGADLLRLVAKLHARPLRGAVYDKRGRRQRRSLRAVDISDLLFDADYIPALRSGVPAAVHAALHRGDAAPMLRLIGAARPVSARVPARVFSAGRFAAVCEEDALPWPRGTLFDQRRAAARALASSLGPGAFFPFDYRTVEADTINLCLRWPEFPASPALPPGPYPSVPTLILQGGEDLRTPPSTSARVAEQIPGAVRIVVEGVGHGVVDGDPSLCGPRRLRQFVAGKPVTSNCKRVPQGVPVTGVPPSSVADLPRVPGLRGRVGRTVAGISATIDDLRFALSPALTSLAGRTVRAGGLRGGWYRDTPRALTLHAVQVVPGIRLSGRITDRVLNLRVTGHAAARGAVRIVRGRIRGTLGGRRVKARLRLGAAGQAALEAGHLSGRTHSAERASPRLLANPLTSHRR